MRVLFLDIDGPLIPYRAYNLLGNIGGVATQFDPVAVANIEAACDKQGRWIVIHSTWICSGFWDEKGDGGTVKEHCEREGFRADVFHEDWSCDPDEYDRASRIRKWLSKHPDVTDYVIVDDEYDCLTEFGKHVLPVSAEDGLLFKDYRRLLDGNWNNC